MARAGTTAAARRTTTAPTTSGATAKQPRADARRNREAILDAAVRCLGRDPDTPVGQIAREAQVGRVTLYGHFATRAELVEAAMVRAIEQGDAALAEVDLTGDAAAALARLIEASWATVAPARNLLQAAQKELPPGRIRELHQQPAARVTELVTRGQEEGTFRTDLPATWLVNLLHHVMHGAAEEVNAGRLDESDAARYITASMVPAITEGA